MALPARQQSCTSDFGARESLRWLASLAREELSSIVHSGSVWQCLVPSAGLLASRHRVHLDAFCFSPINFELRVTKFKIFLKAIVNSFKTPFDTGVSASFNKHMMICTNLMHCIAMCKSAMSENAMSEISL